MAWFVQLMGETMGPYSGSELRKMAESQHIDVDTPVARSKDGPWMTAQRIAGLFPHDDPAPPQMPGSAVGSWDPAHRQADPHARSGGRSSERVAGADPPDFDEPDVTSRYKVLTQRDRWFSGRFEVEKLEDAINAYAARGWKVSGVATAIVTGLAGKREEVVVVLERDAAVASR